MKKKTHTVRTFFILFGFFLLAVATAAVYMLGYTPRTYQPTAPLPEGRVSPYLTHKLGPDFFNNVQLDRPFELTIEQQGANEIFASLCPKPQEYAGFSFSAPAAVFTKKSILLMTAIKIKDTSSVLSVICQPALDAAGQLNLNIRSVSLGALPVTSIARKIARRFADDYLVTPQDQTLAPMVEGVLNNQPFDPAMEISKYNVRLKKLTLEQGKLILLIEPIKEIPAATGPHVP